MLPFSSEFLLLSIESNVQYSFDLLVSFEVSDNGRWSCDLLLIVDEEADVLFEFYQLFFKE